MLKKIVLSIAATAVVMVNVVTYGSETRSFNIPPGELAPALESLAKETGLELIFQPEELKGIRTQGVTGSLSPREAVAKLIDGTRLTIRTDSAGAILIAAPTSASAAKVDPATLRVAQPETAESPNSQTSSNSSVSSETDEGKAGNVELEEVVVTAQKRKERLKDVPISMTVLGGDQLDRSTIPGLLREQLNTIPGISIITTGNTLPFTTVRGVSSNIIGEGSAVGYYLDTVPFGLIRHGTAPNVNPYDLERVEVLLGPQGTLFGASSLNGAIRVLTHDPVLDAFDIKGRTTLSSTEDGDASYGGDLAANLPIIEDKLAARAVVGYQDLGGWIDKLNDKDANSEISRTYRLKLKAQPTEDLSLGLSAWKSRIDLGSHPLSDENRQYPITRREPGVDDFETYGMEIGYEFSRFSARSMTGYLEHQFGTNQDLSGCCALPAANFANDLDANVFSQEVVLTSSDGGPWRWTLGGMYRDAEEHLVSRFIPDGTAGFIAADDVSTSESFAGYGELTRLFLGNRLELTGGLRYFEDEVGVIFTPGVAGAITGNVAKTVNNVSPRVVTKFHVSGDTMVYASYSEGFRSGVPQHPAAIRSIVGAGGADIVDLILNPDTLTNYELGAKGSLPGRPVDFNVALYYMNWKDRPQARSRSITLGGITIPAGFLINAESMSGLGFDLGLTAQPVDGLTLATALSWNNLEFDEDAPDGFYSKGQRGDLSPELTFSGSAGYVFPIGTAGFEGNVLASANYVSKKECLSPAGACGDPQWIGRISFAIRSPQHWGATLFVDNVTDWNGKVQTVSFSTLPLADIVRERPRTIGVQLDFDL